MASKKPPKKKTKEEILKEHAWKPGQSGNPKGRPPNPISITAIVKEMGAWKAPPKILTEYRVFFPELPEDATVVQVLAARSLLKAMDLKLGDVMSKEIWERIDGKVPFPVGGPDGGPIPVAFDFSALNKKQLDLLEKLLALCQKEAA